MCVLVCIYSIEGAWCVLVVCMWLVCVCSVVRASARAYLKAIQRVEFDVFDPRLNQRNHWLPFSLWRQKMKGTFWFADACLTVYHGASMREAFSLVTSDCTRCNVELFSDWWQIESTGGLDCNRSEGSFVWVMAIKKDRGFGSLTVYCCA